MFYSIMAEEEWPVDGAGFFRRYSRENSIGQCPRLAQFRINSRDENFRLDIGSEPVGSRSGIDQTTIRHRSGIDQYRLEVSRVSVRCRSGVGRLSVRCQSGFSFGEMFLLMVGCRSMDPIATHIRNKGKPNVFLCPN